MFITEWELERYLCVFDALWLASDVEVQCHSYKYVRFIYNGNAELVRIIGLKQQPSKMAVQTLHGSKPNARHRVRFSS